MTLDLIFQLLQGIESSLIHIYMKTTWLAADCLDNTCYKDDKYLLLENEKFPRKLKGIIITDYTASEEEILSCISLFCSLIKNLWGIVLSLVKEIVLANIITSFK